MANLPVSYMKAVLNLTSFWGTYPPDEPMEPGMIGKIKKGAFVQERDLHLLPGYDKKNHAVKDKKKKSGSVLTWASEGVGIQSGGAGVKGKQLPASAKFDVNFGRENELVMICKGNIYRGFVDLRAVKTLMVDLLKEGQWDKHDCIVTEVMTTQKAWVLFSTKRNQTAQIGINAKVDPSKIGLPLDWLKKQLEGQAKVNVSFSGGMSAGYCLDLPDGGTPLFRALKFSDDWWQKNKTKIDYLNHLTFYQSGEGDEGIFDEKPPFGTE
jgi:hypothetical protein